MQEDPATKQLTVFIEVVRCKRLWQDPDAPLTISPYVVLRPYDGESSLSAPIPLGADSVTVKTNTAKETIDPFFNETFEFKFPAVLRENNESSLPQVQFQFQLFDTVFEPPRLHSVGQFTVATATASKGEMSLDLKPGEGTEGTDGADESSAARGIILLRHRVQLPKPKVVDLDKDVELNARMRFTSQSSLIGSGDQRLWTWTYFLETGATHWRETLEKKLVETFKETKAERKYPTKTVTDVIVLRWKCKRSHQVLTRYRFFAEKLLRKETFGPVDNEAELAQKLKWKEGEELRLSIAPQRSNKVVEFLDRLWLFWCADVSPSTTMTHISFEHRTKMNSTAFGRTQYEALVACLHQLFIPSLPFATAESFAKQDYDHDPMTNELSAVMKAQHDADILKEEVKGLDEFTIIAMKQLDELIGPAPSTAGTPAVTTSSYKLFAHIFCKWASFWCETLTDAEYLACMRGLSNAIVPAKMKLGSAATETVKTPRSARRKSSARSGKTPRDSVAAA